MIRVVAAGAHNIPSKQNTINIIKFLIICINLGNRSHPQDYLI